jgi:hypothetical protein
VGPILADSRQNDVTIEMLFAIGARGLALKGSPALVQAEYIAAVLTVQFNVFRLGPEDLRLE